MERLIRVKRDVVGAEIHWTLLELVTTDEHKVVWDKLRWTGYDNEHWWATTAKTSQFRTQTGLSGRVYQLEPEINRARVLG